MIDIFFLNSHVREAPLMHLCLMSAGFRYEIKPRQVGFTAAIHGGWLAAGGTYRGYTLNPTLTQSLLHMHSFLVNWYLALLFSSQTCCSMQLDAVW